MVIKLACHVMFYVIKPFYWLTYFTTEFETAGETFEISGPNGHCTMVKRVEVFMLQSAGFEPGLYRCRASF